MKVILATNCVITKGAKRSLLCDLQRFNWWTLPNELADYLLNGMFDHIKSEYSDYFMELLKENILVQISEQDIDNFPSFNLEYDSPYLVENAVFDWKEGVSNYDIVRAVSELEQLGCKNITLRFYNNFNLDIVKLFFRRIEKSIIEATDITMPYDMFINRVNFWMNFRCQNPRLQEVLLHSTPEEQKDNLPNLKWLFCTKEKIIDCTSCGQISSLYFTLNLVHYPLTQNYNNCLFKKIGIDVNGQIKNCPSSQKVLGQLNKDSMAEIIKSSEYLKLGKIRKDHVKVCQDCEFRSICSDCRIYVDNPEDNYSRPAKCDYNPYINLWKGEEGYRSLEECGYRANDTIPSIDEIKVAKINSEIWCD